MGMTGTSDHIAITIEFQATLPDIVFSPGPTVLACGHRRVRDGVEYGFVADPCCVTHRDAFPLELTVFVDDLFWYSSGNSIL